jgi:hypothetical protein
MVLEFFLTVTSLESRSITMREDPFAAWAQAVRADLTLPLASFKLCWRASGRSSIQADIVDEGPLRMLIYRGWITRRLNGTTKPATYLPTVPLTVAHLEALG